jgi:primosomal protein N'
MKIVEVIPIARGIGRETLSYFTSADVNAGALVEIPIRGKMKSGIVVGVRLAADIRTDIRQAPFEFKKIEEMKSKSFLFPEFMESAKDSANYFASSAPAILNSVIPKIVLENYEKSDFGGEKSLRATIHEKCVIQAEDDDRFARYKSIIREEFAKKSSVFFCVPTKSDIKPAFEILSKGIESRVFDFHANLSKKKFQSSSKKVAEESHPILIIGTANFLCLPRNDIGAIIIEKESSRFYKSERRPFVDFRKFAEIFTEKSKIKIILGDSVLRTETIWRYKQGELLEIAPLQFRFLSSAKTNLIDMKGSLDIKGVKQKFKVLSSELIQLVKNTKIQNENMFIFSARRGLSTQTICGDCGTIVLCNKCQTPVTLHKKTSGADNDKRNFFLCHKCGEKKSAEIRCKNCDSWKLKPLGIGIELIEKELRAICPEVKIFRVDKDSSPTAKTTEEIISKFYSSAGSILLGTESALSFLNKKVENCAIGSIDGMFALPDFMIGERVMNIVLQTRALAIKKFIIQTRNLEQKSLKYGLEGNMIDFYKEEIAERQKFNYPPFAIFIKISLTGKKEIIWREMETAAKIFSEYGFSIFPAFVEMTKEKFNLNAVIKITREKWVDPILLSKLRSLPPNFSVEVSPNSLL